jgi:uncharacterized protein YutD
MGDTRVRVNLTEKVTAVSLEKRAFENMIYYENYYTSLLENCDNVWNVMSEVIPTKNSKKKISKQESDCFDAEKLNQHFTTAVAKKANEIELSEESYSANV